MKILFRQIAAAALLALCSGPAHADDDSSAEIAKSGWSGVFVGLHAGHTWGTSRWDVGPGDGVITPNADGFSGGALAGFNTQINRMILGIEADITAGDMQVGPADFDVGGVQSAEIKSIATVRARLGYDMGDWMPFVTAGMGVADLELFDSLSPDSDSLTLTGFVVGGGAEFKLDGLLSTGSTGNLTGRVEYIYGNYGEAEFPFGSSPDPADLETHMLRAALIWRFN